MRSCFLFEARVSLLHYQSDEERHILGGTHEKLGLIYDCTGNLEADVALGPKLTFEGSRVEVVDAVRMREGREDEKLEELVEMLPEEGPILRRGVEMLEERAAAA